MTTLDHRRQSTRYATIVVESEEYGFQPGAHDWMRAADVNQGYIHHLAVLQDRTVAGLFELHGDSGRIESGIEAIPGLCSYDVLGSDPVYLFLQVDAAEPTTSILASVREAGVFIDYPLSIDAEEILQLTLIGEDDALSAVLARIDNLVDFRLARTGPYYPDHDHVMAGLTLRQREILSVAIEFRYYASPRESTHEEIAHALNLSQSTVSEHLQKIEGHIIPRIVQQSVRR